MQTGHSVLRVPASLPGFAQAAAELRVLLDRFQVTGDARYRAELVFEEVTTNVIRYGRVDGAALDLGGEVAFGDGTLVLTFEDNGRPFDPLQWPEPAKPKSIQDAAPGGLGIYLVRKSARDIRYERTPGGRNRLIVTISAE
jgi:serine/threonine-protein kinase RsbW